MTMSKAAALACLSAYGWTVETLVAHLLKSGRFSKKVLEYDSKKYEYHVVGLSVNFELWCGVDGSAQIEIGFVSDH
jgi:hypothetical protein